MLLLLGPENNVKEHFLLLLIGVGQDCGGSGGCSSCNKLLISDRGRGTQRCDSWMLKKLANVERDASASGLTDKLETNEGVTTKGKEVVVNANGGGIDLLCG